MEHEYLLKKREEVLKAIKPICDAFNIGDYDYIVKKTGQTETLKLGNIYIGCSANSISATIDEIIGYLFVVKYSKQRDLGYFKTQILNKIRQYWIDPVKVEG